MRAQEIVAGAGADGQRLDRFLADKLELGRAAVRRLIDAGQVELAGKRATAGTRLRAGETVRLRGLERVALDALPEPEAAARLEVVFEDAWLVVVDKPAGMPTHPLRPGELGTLASALLARYPEMAGVGYSTREPGLLHRLDTGTSGLVLAARDRETFAALRVELEGGRIDKRYRALCAGEVEAPARHRAYLAARGRRVTARLEPFAKAEPIETEILTAERRGAFTLVELQVARARRHQIRAHLALLGHPLAGDELYGGPMLPGLDRHFLHASGLRFHHPRTGVPVEVEADLSADLRAVLEVSSG